jgi:uncharacterized membrane protein
MHVLIVMIGRASFACLLFLLLSANIANAQNNATIKFCNQSGENDMSLAQAFYDPSTGEWMAQGWWNLANGACLTFTRSLGKYGTSSVFYHAQTKKHTWWTKGPDSNYGVEQAKFVRPTTQVCGPPTCRIAGFAKQPVTANQTAVVNIR